MSGPRPVRSSRFDQASDCTPWERDVERHGRTPVPGPRRVLRAKHRKRRRAPATWAAAFRPIWMNLALRCCSAIRRRVERATRCCAGCRRGASRLRREPSSGRGVTPSDALFAGSAQGQRRWCWRAGRRGRQARAVGQSSTSFANSGRADDSWPAVASSWYVVVFLSFLQGARTTSATRCLSRQLKLFFFPCIFFGAFASVV